MKNKTAVLCVCAAMLSGCSHEHTPAVQEAAFDDIFTFTGIETTAVSTSEAVTFSFTSPETTIPVSETTSSVTEDTSDTISIPVETSVTLTGEITEETSTAAPVTEAVPVTDESEASSVSEPEEKAPMIICGGRTYILTCLLVPPETPMIFAGIVAEYTPDPVNDYSSNFAPVGTVIYYRDLLERDSIAILDEKGEEFMILEALETGDTETGTTAKPQIVFEDIESVASVLGTEPPKETEVRDETSSDASDTAHT